MSSTNNQSKITLLDSKKLIKNKINKVYCCPGDIEDNSLLSLIEKIIFPYLSLKK